jgi:hypothetical protein
MMRTVLRIDRWVLLVAMTIPCYVIVGCEYFPESTFDLASESRLPKWFPLPPGNTRADVSVTMSYYIKPWGRSATFILQGKNGLLEKVSGKEKGSEPLYLKNPPKGSDANYPSYEVITVNGITDIIEHRKMEPIFYITDDPIVWKELVEANPWPDHELSLI